jgi:putative hemolysin
VYKDEIAGDIAPLISEIKSLSAFSYEIALAITVITITYFSIVIGELVPKTIALNNPKRLPSG